MAYANLATLPAVYGLYVSFFPVIIFWLFTSSRHNSMVINNSLKTKFD